MPTQLTPEDIRALFTIDGSDTKGYNNTAMKHIIWDLTARCSMTRSSPSIWTTTFSTRSACRALTLEDYRNNMTMPVRDFLSARRRELRQHSYGNARGSGWTGQQRAVGMGPIPGVLEVIRGRCTRRGGASRCFPRR